MAILSFNQISNTQPVNQITPEHIANMRDLLNANHRAEVYYYYAKLLGNDYDPITDIPGPKSEAVVQLMMQAQITTYSGMIGEAALQGNFLAKTRDQEDYNLKLDTFSEDIIKGTIAAIEKEITPAPVTGAIKDGFLTANEIQLADQGVWVIKGLADFFPGNFQLSLDPFDDGTELATSKWVDGFLVAQASLNDEGAWLGKRFAEFSAVDYQMVSNDTYTFMVNKISNVIEGVFPGLLSRGAVIPYTFNTIFNEQPAYLTQLMREEKWSYMQANGMNAPSIFDVLDNIPNAWDPFGSAAITAAEKDIVDYFKKAEASYRTYEADILALNKGEHILVYNEVTGYDLYTVDNDAIFPDALEIAIPHTEGAIASLPDGTGPASSADYTVTLDINTNKTYQLESGKHIILDENRSDKNGIDVVDYSQANGGIGLDINLITHSVKFVGSNIVKDYVGGYIGRIVGTNYADTITGRNSNNELGTNVASDILEGGTGLR